MTRLRLTGFETGAKEAEILTSFGGATITFDTSVVRTGTRSLKVVASAANPDGLLYEVFALSTGVTYYQRTCIYATAAPTVNPIEVMIWGGAGADWLFARWGTDGKMYLYDKVNGANVGSPSAVLSTSAWHVIELGIRINTSTNDDYGELMVDGVSVASSSTLNLSTTAPDGIINIGIQGAGETITVYHDDVAVNDSQGSVNNSWIGTGEKIVMLDPISDNANGGWSQPGGDTTDLFASLDNKPPIGIANSTNSADELKMIRNPNSTAGQNYDANMTSYTTAGIGASDTIHAVQWIMAIGTSSVTGTNNGIARLVSNPDQGSDQTINFEGAGGAQGTYPTNWFHERSPIIEQPTVTKGTSPVLRITKNTAATRVHGACFFGINVGYTVSSGPVIPVFMAQYRKRWN